MAEHVVGLMGVDHALPYLKKALEILAKQVRPGQKVGLELTPYEVATRDLVFRHRSDRPFWKGIMDYCQTHGIKVVGIDVPFERHPKLIRRAEKRFSTEFNTGFRQRYYVKQISRHSIDFAMIGDFHFRKVRHALEKLPGFRLGGAFVVAKWSLLDHVIPDAEEREATRAERARRKAKKRVQTRRGFSKAPPLGRIFRLRRRAM